ncbi:hypothetical protein DPMN_087577 [Dreissena polymorpha]|uniref:Uncharacterized protein n=1 Tax=Dreissena polymorpha TaxID=45954 RepID=A0A9D4KTF0_DREPO|nr:hypothetical protein DPMN_087577 [Dreissena polymorpha]
MAPPRKNAPPPWLNHQTIHVASRVLTSWNHFQTILTKFHEDWNKKNAPPPDIIGTNVLTNFLTRKTSPHPGGPVFQQTRTIFELIQDVIWTYVLIKFHEDGTINLACKPYKENCPALWRPCFTPTGTIFELENRTINVVSRVLKMFYYSHTGINASSPGGHVFQLTRTIFKLFHEDRTKKVASIEKNAPPPGRHVFQPTGTILKLILDII